MSEKIDATLKKIAAGTQSGKTDLPLERRPHDLPGDPNCPICGGIGYYRLDLPIDHPEFGKVQVCSCRNGEVSQQIHQRLFALSNLEELQNLTFENFQSRGRVGLRPAQAESLEQAFNHSRLYAQSLKGWLLLQGGFGCGKTHLAAAIANFAVGMGVPTLFLTVPDLLDTLRFAYDDPQATFEERFNQIRNAPLLVMDDFGTQNATEWAQEKLFQIINYRYINQLPLVVTTNLLLEEIEGRIRSRLEHPEWVTLVRINAPDFRRPMSDSDHQLRNLTFANFEPRAGEGLPAEHRASLKKAVEAARRFAEHPHGWLVITGPYGSGKTHLAASIANYRDDLGISQLFISVPDLLDHLRATFRPESPTGLDRQMEEVRNADFLILDDLGTQNMTPWVREKLFQLFNFRYLNELPTVITTPEFKDEMDPRLLSRLQDVRLCEIVAITAPSYRGQARQDSRRKGSSK